MRSLTFYNSAVFQAGGLVVVVVEVFRRNFLASIVPVVVNAILNEHQLVIDIVSFVLKGDFHRSRLGEKQRGKILAGWVTRKMRTIAQYSIRDPNGSDNQITEVAEPGAMPPGRTSTGTFTRTPGPGSMKGSMRGSMLGMTTQMQNLGLQTGSQDMSGQQAQMNFGFGPPAGFPELPGQPYPESIPERAELATGPSTIRDGNDDTPTEAHKEWPPHVMADPGVLDYSPVDRSGVFDDEPRNGALGVVNHEQYGASGLSTSPLPSILQAGPTNDDMAHPPEPQYHNKPYLHYGGGAPQEQMQNMHYGDGEAGGAIRAPSTGDRWSLPSQNHQGGGLRVANRDPDSQDEDWAEEAIMHMNFAGAGPDEMRRMG